MGWRQSELKIHSWVINYICVFCGKVKFVRVLASTVDGGESRYIECEPCQIKRLDEALG